MTLCFLGLGSNLGHPERQLRRALNSILSIPKTRILAKSALYSSRPCGYSAQPFYQNMVVLIKTTITAINLLRYCQIIEKNQHRVRKKRWGPRTLDIDILLFGNASIQNQYLTVPHPYLTERDFVLIPMNEIAPNYVLPNGVRIDFYLQQCEQFVRRRI